MRRLGVLLALLVLGASVPAVEAHGPGAEPITLEGWFVLTPAGTLDDEYHRYMGAMGLPPDPGDRLRFSWSANAGLGPAVYFEIHEHVSEDPPLVVHYVKEAVRCDDSWVLPHGGDFMVNWTNLHDVDVNITYSFQLFAPPPEVTVLLLFAILPPAIIGFVWWSSRHRRRAKAEGNDSGREDA